MKTFACLILMVGALGMLSCGSEKDADKIGNAQLCMDDIRPGYESQVTQCLQMIEGVSSPVADGIRCAGGFVREGFSNPKRYTDALKEVQGPGADASARQRMMGIMSFGSAGTIAQDFSNISSTFQSCLASGGKASVLLASFSYFTLGLVKFFSAKGFCSSTPAVSEMLGGYKVYDFAGCAANEGGLPIMTAAAELVKLNDASNGDPDAQAAQSAIGAAVIGTYAASCAGTSSSNVELCTILSDSITAAGGTSSPRAVAVEFFTKVLVP